MKNALALLFFVFLLATLVTPSQAGLYVSTNYWVTVLVEDTQHNLLGSRVYNESGYYQPTTKLAEPLTASFSLELDSGKALFANTPLLTNVGKTIWISSNSDDPNYSDFVKTLTNGRNETLWSNVSVKSAGTFVNGYGTGYSESSFFPGNVSHDFAGMTIGRIGLNVNIAGIRQGTGTVVLPEPGSLLSLLSGTLCTCGFALKKK